MWPPATRRQHSRTGLRYETDLTDAEWRVVEPLLPEPPGTGRPLAWSLREILNAIFYVLRGGFHGACCRAIYHRKEPYFSGLRRSVTGAYARR